MELIDKERTYGDYVEGVMEDVQFSKEDIAFAKEHDLVHTAFWGNAQKHLPEIHASGTEICFDYATEMNDPLVEETIPYVDYAFFSYEKEDDFIKGFLKEIVGKGPKIAVATFGEEGSIAWDGKEFYRYGIEEADLVNTIGAGDSFMTAFTMTLLKRGWNKDTRPSEKAIRESFETAAEFSAKNCLREGSFGYKKSY